MYINKNTYIIFVSFRNTRDDISRELAQTRQAITKQIMDNQQGIPTSPYASATSDPEDRSVYIYMYIQLKSVGMEHLF